MKKTIGIILTILGISLLWKIDVQDRYETSLPKYFSDEEQNFFVHYKTVEESKEVIKLNWADEKYQFPREEIATIKYYKNTPFISRFNSKTLSENQIQELVSIINNPINFDWSETTWRIEESNYFFRFFDKDDKEIGELWVCNEKCGMTEIKPWIPTTKYGGLSEIGKSQLTELIDEI